MSLKGKPPTKDVAGRSWSVYTLADPRTLEVRYVGWTTRPHSRLTGHLSEARTRPAGPHKRNWIKSLLRVGLTPIFRVVATGVGNGWESVEASWIAYYRSSGAPITNATDGGEGVVGYVPSAETRARLSAAGKRYVPTAETRAKISAFHKGRPKPPVPDARRRKLSEAGKGRVLSLEAKAKISAFHKGRKKRPYTESEREWMSELHPFKQRTHCKNGHEFTDANTYWSIEPGRRKRRACRTCRASRSNVKRNAARRALKVQRAQGVLL